jgi:hypothetical protein
MPKSMAYTFTGYFSERKSEDLAANINFSRRKLLYNARQ